MSFFEINLVSSFLSPFLFFLNFELQELPPVDVKTSSWKGTLISIVVISFLCSAIILAIYIINPEIQCEC